MSKLGKLIEGIEAVDPSAEAMEFRGQWWTWGDLRTAGQALDQALTQAGLGARTRVGMLMINRPEIAASFLHIMGSGRCLVAVNASLPDERLAAEVAVLHVPALVATAEQWQREALVTAARQAGCLGLELTGDKAAPVRLVPGLETRADDLRVYADEGVGLEMLTSGTTGTPKRIPMQSGTLEEAIVNAGAYDGRGPDAAPKLRPGVMVLHASFAHMSGIFGITNTFVAGRKVALLEKFAVGPWADAIRRHKPKVASAPPTALRMILDAKVPKEDLASLVAFRTGTAPLPPELADEFTERYGIPVLQNYGATETAGAGAGWTLDDYRQFHTTKRGSVGRLSPGIKGRVVDAESGEPLPPGGQGLLELFGPQLGDGKSWMRTTDLAVLDADGFLWIKGRADNAIIRGGFKINPDDIVQAIQKHPAVREAAVVGLPDPRLGAVPAAAYVIRSGMQAPDEAEMKAFLKGLLLPYQVPVEVRAVEALPRTPSLKVSQPELRKIFQGAPA
jgi:acyl-coenzyme A synthetase/AMP-(fatty) acid ligase